MRVCNICSKGEELEAGSHGIGVVFELRIMRLRFYECTCKDEKM